MIYGLIFGLVIGGYVVSRCFNAGKTAEQNAQIAAMFKEHMVNIQPTNKL